MYSLVQGVNKFLVLHYNLRSQLNVTGRLELNHVFPILPNCWKRLCFSNKKGKNWLIITTVNCGGRGELGWCPNFLV